MWVIFSCHVCSQLKMVIGHAGWEISIPLFGSDHQLQMQQNPHLWGPSPEI